MKKLVLLGIFSSALTLLSAQDIYETTKSMSLGTQPVYYMDVEGADEDLMEDIWKDYLKDNYDAKVKKNKKAKEYFSTEVMVPALGRSSKVSLYLKIEEGKGQSTAYLWTDIGGAFVNSDEYATESEGVIKVMTDYFVNARKKVVSEELKEQEKSLEKLDKEHEKLVKKNEDYHEDIEKARTKIREAEENIEKNLNEQSDKRMEIEAQKKIVEMVIAKLNSIGRANE